MFFLVCHSKMLRYIPSRTKGNISSVLARRRRIMRCSEVWEKYGIGGLLRCEVLDVSICCCVEAGVSLVAAIVINI